MAGGGGRWRGRDTVGNADISLPSAVNPNQSRRVTSYISGPRNLVTSHLVECCITSTETVGLLGTGRDGIMGR